MKKQHAYEVETQWTGNLGTGTSAYRAYSRDHEVRAAGKAAPIACSSDAAFRGDRTRYNPEELLVASISTCHMLWYLHLCAEAGIVVVDYSDAAVGTMVEDEDGGGRFTEVVLHPRATIHGADRHAQALALHERAQHLCFVANSLNFAVKHQAEVRAVPAR